MLSRRWPALYWARLVLAAMFCLAMLSQASPALGHAAHPGKEQIYQGIQGPYALRVLAVPWVGYLHVTVVFDGAAVPDEPVIRVSASPENTPDGAIGPLAAQREPLSADNEYSATLDATTEGPWTIFVDIASVEGEAAFTVPVTLRQPDGIPLSAILTGLGLLLPVLWLVGSAVRDRLTSRGNRTTSQTAKGRAVRKA